MNGRIRSIVAALGVVCLIAPLLTAVEPTPKELPDAVLGVLSLRISDESAPAGSIVQLKIDVTEPKPISTGRGKIKIRGVQTVQGIALMNHDQDTFGVALVEGDELTFSIESPSGLFGTLADYPILTIAGTVDPSASLGKTYPLTIDPSALLFIGPSGAEYPIEVKNGQLTVANVVAIGDVSPGGSIVPAGGVVRISGTNFVPDTRVQLSETDVAETHYVNGHRIDVVLGRTTDMQGVRIRARNPDNSEATYFSYQRTTPTGESNDSILRLAVPLFSSASYTTATVVLPKPARRKRRAVGHSLGSQQGNIVPAQQGNVALGFALQNLNGSEVSASVELLDIFGQPYAVNTLSVAPNHYLVREIGEVFGIVAPPFAFRVKSTAPLQVLGIVADHSGGGTAIALPPS